MRVFGQIQKKSQGLKNVTIVEQRNITSVNAKHINQWKNPKPKWTTLQLRQETTSQSYDV